MKNLDAYKLGVVIDAQAAEALKSLARVDAQTNTLAKDFRAVEGVSVKAAKGVNASWRDVLSAKIFSGFNASGRRSFAGLETDAKTYAAKIKQHLTIKANISGGGAGGGIGSVASSVLTGVATGGTGLLLSAVTGGIGSVAGAFKDAAVQGLDFNATVESAQIGLERLLGSSAAATDHIEQLKKAAKISPTGFESLLELDQLLQNAGYSAAGLPKQLADVATGIGQLAGTKGLDERMSRVIAQITQMSNTGRAQFEDLKIIAENGIPVFDLLGKAIGKSKREITELAREGKLAGKGTGEIILEEIARVGQANGDKISKSYAVLRSNIDDAQQQLYGTGTKSLFGASKEAMAGLLSYEAQANQLAATLDSATGKAIDFTKRAVGSIASGDFVNAGVAMVAGVAEGVKGAASQAFSAGAAIVETTIDGVKKTAGINSPAENFKPLGVFISQGVGAGIADGGSFVNEAIGKVVDDALQNGLTKAQAKIETHRQQMEAALANPNVRAMLDTIATTEGAGYRTKVGGGTSSSVSTGQKDRTNVRLSKTLSSTADGRYQFLNRTWDSVADKLGLMDFSERSQDLAAVSLIAQRGALADVLQGNIEAALGKINKEWASLPGSPYGQRTESMKKTLAIFESRLQSPTSGGASVSVPKKPQTSGFTLSLAERQALYSPGATPASRDVALPASLKALEKGTVPSGVDTRPVPVKIVFGGGVDAGATFSALEKIPEALGDLSLKLDPTKLFASRAELTNAKASLFGAEVAAASSTFLPSETKRATIAENRRRASNPTTLFGGDVIRAVGDDGQEIADPTKLQSALAGVKAATTEMKLLGKDAFGSFAQGLGGIIEQFIMTGETGPQAMRKLTAGVLASVAAQAAVKAIFYTAEGIAAATNPFTAYMAPGYFAAAATMAVIAGGAAVAGRAVASGIKKDGQNSRDNNQAGVNQDVTSEGYAGNIFRRNASTGLAYQNYQNGGGNQQQQLQLLAAINNKLNPVNGQQMVLATLANNPRQVARAAVDGVNGDFGTANRLGQRIG